MFKHISNKNGISRDHIGKALTEVYSEAVEETVIISETVKHDSSLRPYITEIVIEYLTPDEYETIKEELKTL